MVISKNSRTFALAFEQRLEIDSLAQQVEHNTFNVGVMGSSPMRVTDLQEKGFPLRKAFFRFFIDYLHRITLSKWKATCAVEGAETTYN